MVIGPNLSTVWTRPRGNSALIYLRKWRCNYWKRVAYSGYVQPVHHLAVCSCRLWQETTFFISKYVYQNSLPLIQGTLRINQRSYEDAYVSSPDDATLPDIYVGGLKDRNRALHGDEVFIMVEDKSRWKILPDRIRDYLETKEDKGGKDSLTVKDVALKMSALKFRKRDQAEVQTNNR